jgi:putative oxidoreductase
MQRILARLAPFFYAVLRLVAGLLFAMHGSQKLFGYPGAASTPLISIAGLAGIIELIAGLMIMLGFRTRYAAFVASGQMAVAYFWRHSPQGFWPIQNRGELAVLYCFLFLYISAAGSGSFSVDGAKGR